MIIELFKKLVKKNIPRWIVLMIDCYIVINTFVLAYLIRFNFSISFDTNVLVYQLPVVFGVSIISFLVIGSYKGIVRHTGLKDSKNVTYASFIILLLLSTIVVINFYLGLNEKFTIPKSIIAIHFLLNVIVLISSRFLFKEIYDYVTEGFKLNKNILIYGAGEAGTIVYSVLTKDKNNQSQVVGFIDDDKSKYGKKINGIEVYDPEKVDLSLIESKSVSEIVISIQNIRSSRLLEMVDRLSKLPVNVKIVPPIKTWIEGELKPKQIKSVKIEDLLGRDPISIDNLLLQNEFSNKVILITGAAGSIGSEITRQLSKLKIKQLVLVDQAESDLYNLQQDLLRKTNAPFTAIVADVRNIGRMEDLFHNYQPQIVFHAAAYKHVPFMEANPSEAINANVYGTKVVADLALNNKTEKFVFISTDKAVNPTNIMGASKRIAELYINSLNMVGPTKYITTRFGNVLGSNGSVIPLFLNQIKNGGPITVTHKDITRYFMTIPEACQLVIEAGCMGKGGEIFVFDMGESIKIYDLALNMIRLSGLHYPSEIDIKITGLRPGEKIYEELLATNEDTIPTYNDKILIAKVTNSNINKNKIMIDELCLQKNELSNEELVTIMKELVPEYKSNNSKYQLLDK